MSLLLKGVAQIKSREPADNVLPSYEEQTAPNVLAEPIEVSVANAEKSSATQSSALGRSTAPQPVPSPAIEKETATPAVISLDSLRRWRPSWVPKFPLERKKCDPRGA